MSYRSPDPDKREKKPKMKKHITLFGLLMLLSVRLVAQTPELKLDPFREVEPTPLSLNDSPPSTEKATKTKIKVKKESKWQLGITAGYLHSSNDWVVKNEGTVYNLKENVSSSPGFTAGLAASLPLNSLWSFDTGVNLSMWGFGYKEPGASMKFSRYMLEIPTFFTMFEPDAYIPIFLQMGLLTSIYLGGHYSLDTDWVNNDWQNKRARDSFSKLSFGILVGIGYGPVTLQFIQNVTDPWSRGLFNEWESQTGDTFSNHSSWAISLTYTYWL